MLSRTRYVLHLRLPIFKHKKITSLIATLSIAFLLCFVNIAFADEEMVDFEDPSISVINEELRQVRDDNRDSKRGVSKVVTIAADDITPDVSGGSIFITSANTGATAITDLDNPKIGQVITIICGSTTNASTITDGGNFALTGNWAPNSVGDNIVLFVKADNTYYEVGRSDN